jgi:hydroxymethylbilane synthase
VFVETYGDLDLNTSLRTLGKTDFFTREVDQLLLKGVCRLAVHSAKDLPDPLPSGLKVVAITRGKDPSDSLVFRPGESLASLPSGAVIATSSVRRQEAVRQLRADLQFIDLRGTIAQRLSKLDSREADGVVVAEAALIRLGLLHLNRLRLPGETVSYQGQLAVIAHNDDVEMASLFSCIDARNS